MPKVSQTVEVKTETRIEPKLRKQLLTKLQQYARLKVQLDALKDSMDLLKAECGDIRQDIGAVSLKLEGFTIQLMAPTHKKFNPKKFVAEGGDMDVYNASFDEVPTRCYEKINVPGEKTKGEDDAD